MPATRLGSGRQGARVDIDPAAALDWEVERAVAGQRSTSDSHRERLVKEQADKLALSNATRRQDHMLRSMVEPVLEEFFTDLMARLEDSSDRIANEVARLSDPAQIRAYLLTEMRAIRAVTAAHLREMASRRQPATSTKA